MWSIFDVIVFAAGFAACWFGKDWILKMVLGANVLSAKLHAKADELKAKL